MADIAPAFVWGDNGVQMTPERIAALRKVAAAAAERGMDFSPIRSPWQGAARVAQALVGGLQDRQADSAEQANRVADQAMLAKLLGGSTQTASLQPAEPTGTLVAPSPASPEPKGPTMVPVSGTEDVVPLPRRNPIGALSPEFRSKFADLRTAAGERGAYFDAPEQGSLGNVRSPQQQAALYAQGRTSPGPVVTGTINSNHITGRALDVVPTSGASEKQIGSVVSSLIESDPRFAGMRSGATFSNLYDPLHVELNKPQGNQVASLDPNAGVAPPPSPGVQAVTGAMGAAPAAAPAAQPNRGPLAGIDPRALAIVGSPYASEGSKKIAGLIIAAQSKDNNPTNDIKEYEMAKRQGFTGSLLDYQVKLKEAGKPVTNINQQQESEYQKATGKHFADLNNNIAQNSVKARGEVATLTKLGTLLADPEIYTGKLGESVLEAKRLAKAAGFDVGDLGGAEAVRAIQNQFALELRNPAGGAGMPGAMSDADRQFLQSLPPGLEKTKEGNQQITEYRKKVAERSIDVDRLRQQYVKTNGRLDEGFYRVLADYSDKNPLFANAAPATAAPAIRKYNPATGKIE